MDTKLDRPVVAHYMGLPHKKLYHLFFSTLIMYLLTYIGLLLDYSY